jgi:hypothetical protein
MLPPPQIMVLMLHLRVGPSLYVFPKQASQELEGPEDLLPPLKGEVLPDSLNTELL